MAQGIIVLDTLGRPAHEVEGLIVNVDGGQQRTLPYPESIETAEVVLAALDGINADPRPPLSDFERTLGRK